MPIAWKGYWHGRAGESLVALGMDKFDTIRNQILAHDWTAQIVPEATLDDLDAAAVHKARESFAQKQANDRVTKNEIANWSLASFLDKLSATLDAEQKEKKASNLLTNLRRAGRIVNTGSRGQSGDLQNACSKKTICNLYKSMI